MTLLLGACAQTVTTPAAQASASPPLIQTVEVEVTRVVYRETLVTPTPAPLAPCAPAAFERSERNRRRRFAPAFDAGGPAAHGQHAVRAESSAGADGGATGIVGVPVRLAIYDTGDDPARSVQRVEQLLTRIVRPV